MTGQLINAQQALQLGLITEIVKSEELLGRAMELAENLQAKSPIALRMAKRCIDNGQNVDLATGLEFEQKVFSLLFATADQK